MNSPKEQGEKIDTNIQQREYTLERLDYDFLLDDWGRPYRFIAYPKTSASLYIDRGEKQMTQVPNWRDEYEKFVIKSNAGTDLLRYTDANLIKAFIAKVEQQATQRERERIEAMIESLMSMTVKDTQDLDILLAILQENKEK